MGVGNTLELSGPDLTDVDLTGKDLTGMNLSGAKLLRAKLAGAKLHGTDFSDADLTDADLKGVEGQGTRFDRAVLIGADLSHARLYNAQFTAAELYGANCEAAILAGAIVGGANFTAANFGKTKFSPVMESAHTVKGMRFANTTEGLAVYIAEGSLYIDGSQIRRHDLTWLGEEIPRDWLMAATGVKPKIEGRVTVFTTHAKLRQEDSSVVALAETDGRNLSFDNLDLCCGNFEGVDFSGSSFLGTKLDGARFTNCKFEGCKFAAPSGKSKSFLSFVRCNFTQAEIEGINFGMSFDYCTFAGTSLHNIVDYKFKRCDLVKIQALTVRDTEFDCCTFAGSAIGELSRCILSGCSLEGMEIPDDLFWQCNHIENPKDFIYVHGPGVQIIIINGVAGRQVFVGDDCNFELSDGSHDALAAAISDAVSLQPNTVESKEEGDDDSTTQAD